MPSDSRLYRVWTELTLPSLDKLCIAGVEGKVDESRWGRIIHVSPRVAGQIRRRLKRLQDKNKIWEYRVDLIRTPRELDDIFEMLNTLEEEDNA